MGRPKGSTNESIETRWFDTFSAWTKPDREAAMKALAVLHRHLPDGKKAEVETRQL